MALIAGPRWTFQLRIVGVFLPPLMTYTALHLHRRRVDDDVGFEELSKIFFSHGRTHLCPPPPPSGRMNNRLCTCSKQFTLAHSLTDSYLLPPFPLSHCCGCAARVVAAELEVLRAAMILSKTEDLVSSLELLSRVVGGIDHGAAATKIRMRDRLKRAREQAPPHAHGGKRAGGARPALRLSPLQGRPKLLP